ncbi:MAG: PadR family transcriptional regulator [Thermoflexia bacterium]|nr:MAG: PadR family transcriptional regulator [Thermoflexia bacterium]
MGYLYNALQALEREGLVSSRRVPQADRPSRKVYSITAAGERVFLEWARPPVRAVWDLRVEFLAKLYFHRVLNLEGTDELLLAQKAWLQERLTQIEAARARTSAEDFRAVVLDLRGRQVRAAMEWVEGLIPRPAEGGGPPLERCGHVIASDHRERSDPRCQRP